MQQIISTHERLLEAKKNKLDYSIETKETFLENGFLIKTRLTIYVDNKERVYESSSYRKITDSVFTALETADTVSLGRALGKAGIGIEHSFITSDEVSVSSLIKAKAKTGNKSINSINNKLK